MKQVVLALGFLGVALGANAALLMRKETTREEFAGSSRVFIGGRSLDIPRTLFRDRAQMAGGRLDRLDLAVSPFDFSPVPPPSAKVAQDLVPDSIVLSVTPKGDAPDPTDMFQNVYARFFSRENWSNPGGLVMRRFRAGTPYEDREIYIGAGGAKLFVALCPVDVAAREIEPCTATVRQDGFDIEMRFHARHLPDWRRLTNATVKLAGVILAAR